MKKILKSRWPELLIFIVSLVAFFPALFGKIPLNARNLVSFFSPWCYEKFEGFPTGVPSKLGMLDQLRIYYPYMDLTKRMIESGQLPLWNPYNFMGNPHMAEWQSGVFYPLHLLLPLLSLPTYWSLFQIIGFFLTGLFTYYYLRNLKLGTLPSLYGSLAFMLSSFMTTWNMEVVVTSHSILWLPLLLLAVDKIAMLNVQRSTLKWWLAGLGGLVCSILSGYWQTTFYVMAVVAIYIIYRSMLRLTEFQISNFKLKITVRQLAETVSMLAWFPLSGFLTAFHLLPTWELYQRSGRLAVNSAEQIKELMISYLLPLRHLVTFLIPDYFGHPTTANYFAGIGGTYYEHVLFVGGLTVVFAVVALFAKKTKEEHRLFWLWTLVGFIAESFSFRTPWATLIYDWNIPVLSSGIANRILFVPAFALCVIAAFGIEKILQKTSYKRFFYSLLLIFSFLGLVLYSTWSLKSSLGVIDPIRPTSWNVSLRNSVIPVSALILGGMVALAGAKKKFLFKISLVIILVVGISQNLYQHYKFTAFSEQQFIYPQQPIISWLQQNARLNRFTGYNGKFMNDNFATYFGIYSIEGYDSLNDYRRSSLLKSAEEGILNGELSRSDAVIGYDLSNPRTVRLFGLTGVKYFIERPDWVDYGPTEGKPRLPTGKEKLVFQDGDWKAWEYQDALPRTFLVGDYELVEDGQPLITRLYEESFDPHRSVLLAQKPPDEFDIREDAQAQVEIADYRPTKIIFNTSSTQDQLLFLSDTWYPGWRAKLENGKELPVMPADYALRAVPIPEGEHTITMWYLPDSFKNGAMIAVITAISIAALAMLKFRKHA